MVKTVNYIAALLLILYGVTGEKRRSSNLVELNLCSNTDFQIGNNTMISISAHISYKKSRSSCSLKLKASKKPVVAHFYFQILVPKLSSHCNAEWFCLNGVKFCGPWLFKKSLEFMIPAERNFTIKVLPATLSTRATILSLALDMSVTFRDAVGQTVTYPNGGVGNNPRGLINTTKTFNDEYIQSYSDRCSSIY